MFFNYYYLNFVDYEVFEIQYERLKAILEESEDN